MRIIGIVLVLLGAIILGYGGFIYLTRETVVEAGPVQVAAEKQQPVQVSPVAGGIAVISGLIAIATSSRRETV